MARFARPAPLILFLASKSFAQNLPASNSQAVSFTSQASQSSTPSRQRLSTNFKLPGVSGITIPVHVRNTSFCPAPFFNAGLP